MINYQVGRNTCTHCNKNIRRGIRRFGPAQVRCGHCDTVLNTNLDGWASLSSERRILLAVQEFFFPSWIGVQASSCNGLLATFFIQLFFWFLCFLPFVGLVSLIGNPSTNIFSNILMYLGMSAYPILLIVRLIRMIQESNAFTRTGTPPIWK
jgi:hypothetical protein